MKDIELKIVISQNKYGYLGAYIYYDNNRLVSLTDKLSTFEITYLNNRQEHITLDIARREYKGEPYDALVIRDTLGYEDEFITLRLDNDTKKLIMLILEQTKGDVL